MHDQNVKTQPQSILRIHIVNYGAEKHSNRIIIHKMYTRTIFKWPKNVPETFISSK